MKTLPAIVPGDNHPRNGLWTMLASLVSDDDGQDIIEYAFLAAFIGVAGWAALSVIDDAVESTYRSYFNTTTGVPSLWDPPEPIGSSPP